MKPVYKIIPLLLAIIIFAFIMGKRDTEYYTPRENNTSGLVFSLNKNRTNKDRPLIENLYDRNITNYGHYSFGLFYSDMFNYESALLSVAENGDSANLARLIEAKEKYIDIDTLGRYSSDTPLLAAARSGSAECVRLLLNAGANPEFVSKYGYFPLYCAVLSGNEESVRLLLDTDAVKTINRLCNGTSPLMAAAGEGHCGIIRLLLRYGAGVNARSGEEQDLYYMVNRGFNRSLGWPRGGQTALMFAKTIECVEILLNAGADVNIRDNAGRNALLFQTYFNNDVRVISRLIDAGSYLYLDVDGGMTLLRLAGDGYYRDNNNKIIAELRAAGCADNDPDVKPLYCFPGVDTR
jgi:ankyrin repeat protein